MRVFVDTSAFLALLEAQDPKHPAASSWWRDHAVDAELWTHNYVLLETIAVGQNRLGPEALRGLQEDFFPQTRRFWVSEELHDDMLIATLASGARTLSHVDQMSFAVMRQLGIEDAFAFDDDFEREGFRLVA